MTISEKFKNKKGWCSVCGEIWCNEHDCCPLDCAHLHGNITKVQESKDTMTHLDEQFKIMLHARIDSIPREGQLAMPLNDLVDRILWGTVQHKELFHSFDSKLSPLQSERFRDFVMKWALSEMDYTKAQTVLNGAYQYACELTEESVKMGKR